MIKSAVADIVGIAVTADNPEGTLGEVVLKLQSRLSIFIVAVFERADEFCRRFERGFGIIHILAESGNLFFQFAFFFQSLEVIQRTRSQLFLGDQHTKAVFSRIFKEGVGPGDTVAFAVLAIGRRRSRTTIDGGAARRIGDLHAFAEELADQLEVRSFTAARAGAGELEERLFKLAALDGALIHRIGFARQAVAVFPVFSLFRMIVQRLHREGLLFGRADVGAGAAARAVKSGGLNTIAILIVRLRALFGHEALRRVLRFFFREEEGANDGVRADVGALVALNAVVRIPDRDIHGDTAFLELCGSGGEGAVFASHKGGNRKRVTLLSIHHVGDIGDEIRHFAQRAGLILSIFPLSRNLEFAIAVNTGIYGGVVHVDDLLALVAVGFDDGFLHVFHGISDGNNLGDGEEGRLADRVDAVAEADFLTEFNGVDDIEFDLVLRQEALDVAGQILLDLGVVPGRVEQEGTTLLQRSENIVVIHIALVVAGHEVGLIDQVGRTDGRVAETQIGNGDTAGFLRVVAEVSLSVHIRVVADNLDGVLVGADRSVRAKAPEAAGNRALGRDIMVLADGQGEMGHIVVNANGETLFGIRLLKLVENSEDLSRGRFFGAEAVTSADD